MWSGITFLLFLLSIYTSNGQIEQASIAEQNEKLLGGKKTLIGGKKLLALHAKIPAINQELQHKPPRQWPNGQVRYYIDENSYDREIGRKLKNAFDGLTQGSCPLFTNVAEKPSDASGSWLHFTNPDRVRPCVHPLPDEIRSSEQGEIVVVLGYDCLMHHQILHTVMHALGFHDEVTHPKRDLYVRIMWEDIQPAFRYMFRLQSMPEAGGVLDYDPKSIMHFHDHAYSLTGNPTIAALLPGLSLDPSRELSHIDKMKLRLLFSPECKKRQINKILHSCAPNKDGTDGDVNNSGGTNGNGGVVIPGNDVKDVKPDYGDASDDASAGHSGDTNAKIIIPGDNVKVISDPSSGEPSDDKTDESGNGGDEGQIVVPGNDVSTIEEIRFKPDDKVVPVEDNVQSSESQASQAGPSGENGGQGSQASGENMNDGIKTLKGDKSQVALEDRNVVSDK